MTLALRSNCVCSDGYNCKRFPEERMHMGQHRTKVEIFEHIKKQKVWGGAFEVHSSTHYVLRKLVGPGAAEIRVLK